MCVAGKSFRRHHKLHVMCVEYNISIRFFSFFGKYYVDALRLIAFIVFTFSCICCFLLLVLLLLLLLYAEPKKPHPHLHTAHTSFINIVGCQNGLHIPPRDDDEKNTGMARASNRCYLITFFMWFSFSHFLYFAHFSSHFASPRRVTRFAPSENLILSRETRVYSIHSITYTASNT